ncbi:NACHT domain-containing protein [Sergentomyia squamirostris]
MVEKCITSLKTFLFPFGNITIIHAKESTRDIKHKRERERVEPFPKNIAKILVSKQPSEFLQDSFSNEKEGYSTLKSSYTAQARSASKIILYYPPKATSYQSECELSGSYVSLECPSPPGPPACLPESRRDPQSRLSTFLKTLYLELALKEPAIPAWAPPVAPGALSAARLEPELRLHMQSHGTNEIISVDQLLMPIQTKDGPFLEAPRRVLVECPTWAVHSTLALRILHAWARDHPWPQRGTPVAVTIFVPLAELKGSISSYVAKELLPKGPTNPFASGFGGFNSAWNSLSSLKAKLLFVLDGYDTPRGSPKRKGKSLPADVIDLLEGRLFPDARIVVISVATNCSDLLPMMQRHVTYEGLTWGRSASLLGGGQWGAPSRLLDTVQQCAPLRSAIRTTIGCLAISSIYDTHGGDLPTDEIDVVESVINCVGSESSANNAAELGRLALFTLKTHRSFVTTSEIRMYCSSPDATILGCLEKAPLFGRTARRKGETHFTPVCAGVAEFLAASYLASLANRPGLLAAEIAGMSLGDEVDAQMLKILTFSMSLLGGRAHILLSRLTPLWLSPQTIFSLAIAGGEAETNLIALSDLLGISKSPPVSPLEMRPIWVQIRSTPTELRGWGMALKSPSCTLRNLELAYQMEKSTIHDARNGMDHFLEALVCNDSVTTLRISSLIEIDAKETEIGHLANCVAKALTKPKLETFELILTLLEEDPPILKLQAVVSALCRSIPRQPKLSALLLDLGLCTSQLVQLCTILEKCPQITRLSLPHLRCERGAVGALAALLTRRPITSLALPSCWGARDDPPSSSGVSMGSGSGSSTGTSGIIKQSSLTGAPSPRSFNGGIFSSLPRGCMPPHSAMGRSATLPRQPMELPADKRSSDSVVSSKPWYPTPACEGGPHSSGTLHDLFLTIRESYSRLNGLDLSKAQLSLEDAMCLGETVRLSSTLHSIKIEGASRLSEILPSVLGASESPCLQMMSIGSQRLALEDGAIAMASRALANCATLKLLSVEGWSFRIESAASLSALRAFLSFTSVRELALANCRLHLPIFKSDSIPQPTYECRSVVVIKISGAQVILGDHAILRGPQLLPYICGFPCLRELDLSAPARSGLGGTTSTPLIMDDKCVITFFQCLHLHFGLLNTLKMCNWILHLDDATKTLKIVSKSLRNSPLSHIKVDGISVLDRAKKHRIEPQFMHILFAGVPQLRWMGISLGGMREDQIAAVGAGVLDLKGNEIDIRLSDSTIENARLMTQAIGLDGKFDIRVSTFGTSTGILIHVERAGNKSLSRKRKD